jgi:hypothetical protein
MGCNGVGYRSLLGPGGSSFALFNVGDAELQTCWLETCTAIETVSGAGVSNTPLAMMETT